MSILSDKTFLLDLETSGLHRDRDQIISIGMLYEEDGHQKKMHLFISSLEEEKKQLTSFIQWCHDYDTIVTFRGKGFDYPFLLARLRFHKLADEGFLKLKLIDAEKYLAAFSRHRKVLENALGYERRSTSSGQDIAHLYKTYLASPKEVYKDLILRHQEDELDSLYAIWELYQALYHLKSAVICQHQHTESVLELTYQYAEPFHFSFNGSAYGFQLNYQADSQLLHLSCPLLTAQLKHALSPVKDYYYVESQRQLMHKSLAAFLPATLKRKAKKEECFVYETHTFIRIFSAHQLKESLWYDEQNIPYLIWQPESFNVPAQQIFSLFFQSKKEKA